MRIKGVISYNGKNFYGFQIQKNPQWRSVQKEIQDVLSHIFSTEIKIAGSGRTDRGVHALNQVIHFDIPKEADLARLRYSLNSMLGDDIYIRSLEKVSDDFHARFSAKGKEYHYVMNLGEYDPFRKDTVYNCPYPMDIDLIKEAMPLFVGEHSFINFCGNDDEDYVRTIYSFELEQRGNDLIFKICGNGFRRYMVRMIIGTLVETGRGKITKEKIEELLKGDKFARVSYKAPPEGLYLYQVMY